MAGHEPDGVAPAPDPAVSMRSAQPIFINPRVLPFHDAHEVAGRGTEYSDKLGHQDYELYLAVEDIDHILPSGVLTMIRDPRRIWSKDKEGGAADADGVCRYPNIR